MKLICPRVIRGNRGDLASRYGILHMLRQLGQTDITVFCRRPEDIGGLAFPTCSYGPLYNLIPTPTGLAKTIRCDAVIWTGGLDLQDDSSLLKLLHTYLVFSFYRMLGKDIYVLMQGAGPITTFSGRFVARRILRKLRVFAARDSGSFELIQGLWDRSKVVLGCDGVFCGPAMAKPARKRTRDDDADLLIGFNIRRWFHFSGSLLPYQLAKSHYEKRSAQNMNRLLESCRTALTQLLQIPRARIILISMYETGIEPWEDDLPLLMKLKDLMGQGMRVQVAEQTTGLADFRQLLGSLDLMIGMRLHSSLLALCSGTPSLHICYTLKGNDILRDLGLSNLVIDLREFMTSPLSLVHKTEALLEGTQNDLDDVLERSRQQNESLLRSLFPVAGAPDWSVR